MSQKPASEMTVTELRTELRNWGVEIPECRGKPELVAMLHHARLSNATYVERPDVMKGTSRWSKGDWVDACSRMSLSVSDKMTFGELRMAYREEATRRLQTPAPMPEELASPKLDKLCGARGRT